MQTAERQLEDDFDDKRKSLAHGPFCVLPIAATF